MRQVLTGFGAIWSVILVGYLPARYEVLGPHATWVLVRLVSFVAAPALLVTTLARSSLAAVLTGAGAVFVQPALVAAGHLAVLDSTAGERASVVRRPAPAVRPQPDGRAAGLAISVSGWHPPPEVMRPFDLARVPQPYPWRCWRSARRCPAAGPCPTAATGPTGTSRSWRRSWFSPSSRT